MISVRHYALQHNQAYREVPLTLTVESVEQQLLHLVRTLPPARAVEVLDFAEFLVAREESLADNLPVALQDSFGIWRDRTDLSGDSAGLVRAMRDEWQAREEQLGLR